MIFFEMNKIARDVYIVIVCNIRYACLINIGNNFY